MAKIIVLMGAPGAGKGTQARLLQERMNLPQVSTGDMFREMKSLDTPLAREVQAIMASGKLISDDITYRIVRDRASRPDTSGTYGLDGYPRTAVQAEQLEQLAVEQGKEIGFVDAGFVTPVPPRADRRAPGTGAAVDGFGEGPLLGGGAVEGKP